MPVAVLFSLQVAADVTVGEGDLPAALNAFRDKLGPDRFRGRLLILASNQPAAFIDEDDLEFAVQQVLEALPSLASGTPAAIGFSEAPGRVELTPNGGDVQVVAEYFKPLTAPADELLPALLACCERFMAFVRGAFPDRSGVLERIAQLEPWLARARNSLAAR